MKSSVLKYVVLIVVLFMAIVGSACAATQIDQTATQESIFLHTGSPLILSGNQVMALDPDNLDVAATVINSRTLVPLRAISEYFGASVAFDQEKYQAMISYEGKQYIFPINAMQYVVSDKTGQRTIAMDTSSRILNNRTMVPIRVISEDILGKSVSYCDRVIGITEREINLEQQPSLIHTVKEKIGTALKARSVEELQQVLKSSSGLKTEDRQVTGGVAAEKNEAQPSSTSNGSYSETNVQVEGIDEADIAKTDGKYIYLGGNNAVRMIHVENGLMTEGATIRLPLSKYVSELYVDGDRLVIMGNRNEQRGVVPMVGGSKEMERMPWIYPTNSFSFVDVYDISNPEKPVFQKSHEMQGNYQTSRKIGDVVYLITNTYVYGDDVFPIKKDTGSGSEINTVALDDIMIMPQYPAPGYLVISAINIKNEDKAEVEAIAATGYVFYMNNHALYIAGTDNSGNTTLSKFEISGTKVGYAGSGKVKGSLLNQFSMDEEEGCLRVATNTWENENALYVLDDSLNVYGAVTGFAPGERIYSVRFFGDKAYVVTFRTIDPLFVFDLSDPTQPKKTGELKVPGFSNYLHPVGENQILGIGQDTFELYRKDEAGNEIVVGVRQGGLKISLFDVSDMGKPKEISKLVIGAAGSYSEALYNHKAVMIDSNKYNLALDVMLVQESEKTQSKQQAIIVNYGKDKLTLKGTLNSTQPIAYGSDIPYGRRVLYVGNVLFYIQDGTLASYQYDTLKPIDALALQ